MKILLLTSLYPVPENRTNTTSVVHYFAREWVKLGCEVKVIHNENKFVLPLYFLPRFLKEFVESYFGVRIPRLHQRSRLNYNLDGVTVYRVPILKVIPFGLFSRRALRKQVKSILSICEKDNFSPEVICGHWEYPQLPLVIALKSTFTPARTVLVFHGIHYVRKYPNFRAEYSKIDLLGFRSKSLRDSFLAHVPGSFDTFICYSGIPDEFVYKGDSPRHFCKGVRSFAFVGLMIKRKYPNLVFDCLIESKFSQDFSLKYVGEGTELAHIKKTVRTSAYSEKVSFLGRIDRLQVLDVLRSTDCFIMISKDEAFGLVYLEAMLAGCIVIASVGEGVDGIILDGYNGFLIKSGSSIELVELLNRVSEMRSEELKVISENAINTARKMSDSSVALEYFDVFRN